MKRSRAARPEPNQKPPGADILPRYPAAAEPKGAWGEDRNDELGQPHGERVDVPGGMAEEAMKPRSVPVADMATGEDELGHVTMTLREDPSP
jgi:hypothetical protein